MSLTKEESYVLAFIGFTHAGIYCKLCLCSFACKYWRDHFRKTHPEMVLPAQTSGFVECLNMKVEDVKRSKSPRDLTDSPEKIYNRLMCKKCSNTFIHKQNLCDHWLRRKKVCSESDGYTKVKCYKLLCGRYYPTAVPEHQTKQQNQDPLLPSLNSENETPNVASNPGQHYMQFFASLPRNNLCTTDEVDSKLRRLIAKGDDTKHWRKIFHKAIGTDPFFIEHHKSLLESKASKPHIMLKVNRELQLLMDLFIHLESQRKGIVYGIPANIKAKLVKFVVSTDEGCELEGATTWTFQDREKTTHHVNEFRHLLCYLNHIGCPILQKYLSIVRNPLFSLEEAQRSCIIAKLIYELAIEEPSDLDYIPVICRFAQFQCMFLKDGSPRFKSPNICGKVFASVLYTLRFGVLACTSMMLHGGHEIHHASEMVTTVQRGHVINTVSPWISYCKAMSVRKANTDTSFYADNGDIICNNAIFQKQIYCRLIPLVCSSIHRLFSSIFESEEWHLFLPESGSCVQIGSDWYTGDVQAQHNGANVTMNSLKIIEGYHSRHPLHQELVSEIEILFHGLSGGCERYSTVSELLVSQIWITRSLCLFFKAVHNKKPSVRTTAKKAVIHQLPPSTVIFYLLFRRICTEVKGLDGSSAVPSIPLSSRTHTMVTALCRHFELDPRSISLLDIRHLYTSATNVLAESSNERMVADSAGAMSNNHTLAVHERHYATSRIGAEARRWSRYHKFFGEPQQGAGHNIVLRNSLISKAQQVKALQTLFGERATFTGPDQECMIDLSCNSPHKHKYFGVPCGHGKSLSLLVPIIVEKNLRLFSGCRIIVVPYGFLKDSLEEAFITKLRHVNGRIEIRAYSAGDICERGLPYDLTLEDPPEIVLLTVDAAAKLIRYHTVFLKTLHQMKSLRGIWIDEIQTLYSEFNFRRVYEILPQYAAIGAPITLLSGSFPARMVPSLMRYLKLLPPGKQAGELIDIMQGENLVGSGFQFDVIVVQDKVSDTLEIMCEYYENFGRSIHVLCASKATCKEFEGLLQHSDDVRVVHADTSRENQRAAASDWYHGRCKKLFTTSIGVVGNENEAAGLICIVGLLHDLSSFLQAIGRLRPKQRGPNARVYQILLKEDLHSNQTKSDECDFKRSELVQAGVLSEDEASTFDDIFHIDGYRALLNGEGCYLRRLETMFSKADSIPPTPCGCCTWCRTSSRHLLYTSVGTPSLVSKEQTIQAFNAEPSKGEVNPIGLAAEAARVDERSMANIYHLAMCKIAWLKNNCPACKSMECIGECMQKCCYICGDSTHKANKCNFHYKASHGKSLDVFLKNKNVCNWCFGKMGEEKHGPMTDKTPFELHCPLKNKLRCAVNLQRRKEGSHPDFGKQMREICASDECYYRYISMLNVDSMF